MNSKKWSIAETRNWQNIKTLPESQNFGKRLDKPVRIFCKSSILELKKKSFFTFNMWERPPWPPNLIYENVLNCKYTYEMPGKPLEHWSNDQMMKSDRRLTNVSLIILTKIFWIIFCSDNTNTNHMAIRLFESDSISTESFP